MGWPYPDYRMPRLGMHTVTARHVMDAYARHVMDAVAFPFPREKCQTLHDQMVMNLYCILLLHDMSWMLKHDV